LIFSSDNGPVWYAEDVARFDHDSSGGLRGMKGDAWENGHRMPFIVRWPGNVAPGSTSHQMISFVDFLATFAELTGASLPAGAGPDSVSFLSVLRGTQPDGEPVRKHLALESATGARMLRDGPWKFINALGSGGFSKPRTIKPTPGGPTGQLYNLDEDPGELNNRYLELPEKVAEMKAQLAAIEAATQTRP